MLSSEFSKNVSYIIIVVVNIITIGYIIVVVNTSLINKSMSTQITLMSRFS